MLNLTWPMNAETPVYVVDEDQPESERLSIKHLKLGDTFHLFPVSRSVDGLPALYFVLDVKRVKRPHMRTKRVVEINVVTQHHEFITIALRYNDKEVDEISGGEENRQEYHVTLPEDIEPENAVKIIKDSLESLDLMGEDLQ